MKLTPNGMSFRKGGNEMAFDPETFAITVAMMSEKQVIEVGNSVYIDENDCLVFEESEQQ